MVRKALLPAAVIGALVIAAGFAFAPAPAQARVVVGVGIGVPFVGPAPWYYPPPVVYAPPVYVPPPVYVAPPVYVPPPVYTYPMPAPAPATLVPQSPKWYYCDSPKGYYPYVQNCNYQWREVPAQPNSAPPR